MNKSYLRLIIGAVFVALLFACSSNETGDKPAPPSQPDTEEPITPIIDEHNLPLFSRMGGELLYELEVEGEWIIRYPEGVTWITSTPSSGIGKTTITLKVKDKNTNPWLNRAVLEVISKDKVISKLKITQQARIRTIAPTTDQEYVKRSPEFKWNEFTSDQKQVKYIVSYSLDQQQWVQSDSLESLNWILTETLEPIQDYYWQVAAYITGEQIAISDLLKFTTGRRLYEERTVRKHFGTRTERAPSVIFIGDGFTDEDYEVGGAFDQVVERGIEGFFRLEPFKSYKAYFNVYSVVATSTDRGVSTPGVTKSTVFSTSFKHYSGSEVSINRTKVYDYVKAVTEVENMDDAVIIFVPNIDRYAGVTIFNENGPEIIAVCPISNAVMQGSYHAKFENLVMHEGGGHGFGRLGDEYSTGSSQSQLPGWIGEWEAKRAKGEYANVEMESDPNKVSWKHFINDPDYSDYVGVYEGALTYPTGFWRPEPNSCMRNNIPYYNAPSREAIVKRIFSIVGEQYSFEKFKEKDIERTIPQILQ